MSATAGTRPARPAAGAGKAKARRRKGVFLPLFGAVLVAVAVLPTTIVLAAGMIPTLVAWIVDRDDEKYAPITVGVMNLCGVLPGLLELWTSGHRIGTATDLIMDPYVLLWAFGAASVGWAIHMGIPPIVGLWHGWRTNARIAELEDRKRQLVEEWGREITDPVEG